MVTNLQEEPDILLESTLQWSVPLKKKNSGFGGWSLRCHIATEPFPIPKAPLWVSPIEEFTHPVILHTGLGIRLVISWVGAFDSFDELYIRIYRLANVLLF